MAKTSANIRMYRLDELGDCFLVTFTSGASKSRLLIDCGSFRNTAASMTRLKRLVQQIAVDTQGQPLDVVVGTHQHNDHVSGFVHCKTEFEKIGVRRVWLSWLDDPGDAKAHNIGKDHNNLMLGLAEARDRLHAQVGRTAANRPTARRSLMVLDDILGFYGANAAGSVPELPAKGIANLKAIGTEDPVYLRPGRTLEMPGLPASSVRIHVLGPPRDEKLLYRKDPRKGESYDHALANHVLRANSFLAAVKKRSSTTTTRDSAYPFKQAFERRGSSGSKELREMRSRYRTQQDHWRTINDDWLLQSESLALYLDTFTNNSSLVLAIELVESGKVLLFAADAQTGNWASWEDVKWERADVSTDDLLARTVLYKVGHHASHNATLVDTFEKLGRADLIALIPVHKKDPNITKANGWKMPAKNLFKRLVEKTDHRVLQMDDKNPASCDPKKEPAKSAWKRAGIKPKVTAESIEVEITG